MSNLGLVRRFVICSVLTPLIMSNNSLADTLLVPDDFTTIQAAIDAAFAGDEIIVSSGTYGEMIDMRGKSITLRSSDPTNPAVVAATIIDAGGAGRVILCETGEDTDTVIDGFTITGGVAVGGGGMRNNETSPTVSHCVFDGNTTTGSGGGVYNLNGSPSFTSCTFINNTATDGSNGGGMFNDGASPVIIDCTFAKNSADFRGGGICNLLSSNPVITDCAFDNNTAADGAGICNLNDANPDITSCTFTMNDAAPADKFVIGGTGGGISNRLSSPSVMSCTFEGNTAQVNGGSGIIGSGGAMYNGSASEPLITSCHFIGNAAPGGNGGGMSNIGGSHAVVLRCTFDSNDATGGGGIRNESSKPTITNSQFYGNTATDGAAMDNLNASDPVMTNCTFAGNSATLSGGAMRNFALSTPIVRNSVLWNNSPDQIIGDVVVTYSDVEGGIAGEGNIDVDPLFVDPGMDDLHLSSGSPCIDAGDNSSLAKGTMVDLEGSDRFVDDPLTPDTGLGGPPIVDMGAYEFQRIASPCPADLNGDSEIGAQDLAELLGNWGPCKECPADLDGDGVIGPADLAQVLGSWGPCV